MFRNKQNAVEKGKYKQHTHIWLLIKRNKKKYCFRINKTTEISMILFEIPNIYKKHFFGRKTSKSREGVQFIYASNSFICEFAIWKLSKKSKVKNWWTIWQFVHELLSALDHILIRTCNFIEIRKTKKSVEK